MVTKFVTTSSQGNLFNAADMYGLGNDTLYLMLPTPNDAAIRTYQGNDLVIVSSPATGLNGYRFFLGTGDDTLFGSNLHDEYYDEGGDDQINMGAGSDEVFAGPGNDTIDAGSDNDPDGIGVSGDTIYFGRAYDMFGNPTPVTQGVNLNLASTVAQNLGFYGSDTILNFENAVGGSGDDTFLGTNGKNYLYGKEGADSLRGFGGDDIIRGHDGSDTLIGDAGADELYLGDSDGDPDIVKYFRLSDSTYVDGMDTIFNFEHFAGGGNDKIDLSFLDATSLLAGNQTFQFVGSASFSLAGGEVRVTTVGDKTVVMVDNDGDSAAEMVILVDGVTGLTADDFIL